MLTSYLVSEKYNIIYWYDEKLLHNFADEMINIDHRKETTIKRTCLKRHCVLNLMFATKTEIRHKTASHQHYEAIPTTFPHSYSSCSWRGGGVRSPTQLWLEEVQWERRSCPTMISSSCIVLRGRFFLPYQVHYWIGIGLWKN